MLPIDLWRTMAAVAVLLCPTLANALSPAEQAAADESNKATAAGLRRMEAADAAVESGDLVKGKGENQQVKSAAEKAASEAAKSNDPSTMAAAAALRQAAMAQEERIATKQDGICGGGMAWRPCFFAGAFLASASMTTMDPGAVHGGQTTHAIVSAVIPTAGLRFPMDSKSKFSLDAGALSMLLSKDVTSSDAAHESCRVKDGEFEQHLPCEGNAKITPIAALYGGLTVGTEDIGLLSFLLMGGLSTTSLDGGIHPFAGIAVGLINVNKILNP